MRRVSGAPLPPVKRQPATAATLPVDYRRSSFPVLKDDEWDWDLTAGTVLEGKYRIDKEIGRGSMGTVYVAEDITLKRRVAVKFLLTNLLSSGDCAERFRDEAVAMASIRDQNVAQIFTYGELKGRPYFVMEFLDGQSVEALVDNFNDRGDFIPIKQGLDIVWQLLGGLGEIHRSGTVHRDIKPANIVLTQNPTRAVILDFGLVRDVRVKDDTVSLAGTPAYIAPEIVQKREGSDRSPLIDVYSAGSTAYELLTGTIPFTGNDWQEILFKRLDHDPVPPSVLRAEIPEELDEVVLKALSREPDERYQSSEEFLRHLMMIDEIVSPAEPEENFSIPSRRDSLSSWRSGRATPVGAFSAPEARDQGRLLVVDGDESFSGMVRSTARVACPGCEVEVRATGEEALALLEEFGPHVVVVDFSTPEAGGAELAATIQADPKYSRIEVVAVADVSEGFESEILEWLGVTHFLEKPTDMETMADSIRPLLS